MTSPEPRLFGPERFRKLKPLAALPALFAVYALGRFALRYDLATLPAGQFQLAPAILPGARFICIPVGEETPLGRGSIVEYSATDGPRFSRIVGVAGDVLAWRPRTKGGFELWIGETPTGVVTAKEPLSALPSGPLDSERFVVLDHDPDVGGDDSRVLGPLTRSAILRKAIFTGFGS
jgi:hypothetical protein